MKKNITIFFLLFYAFISNAQQPLFKGNNNYITSPVAFQAPAIIQTGLILNLDAANPSSYPGTGTTWSNLIRGNNVAEFALAGGDFTSNAGGVIRFGSNGSGPGTIGGSASSSTGFSNLTRYTIEIWVKPAGTRGDYDPSSSSGTSTNYTPCFFSEKVYNSGSGAIVNMVLAFNARGLTNPTANNSYRYESAINYGGWKKYQIATDYSSDLNNWIHIVSTFDGSILTIYRNGVSLGTSSALGVVSLRQTSNGYYIARRWDMTDGVYGDYSIVNMYNRALSPSEVTTNYNAVKSRFGL
jgi:hypothetical protein